MDFVKLGKVIDRRYNAVYNFSDRGFMGGFISAIFFASIRNYLKKFSDFDGKIVDKYYQNMIKLFKMIHKNTWFISV